MQPLFQSLKTIATLVNYTIRFRSFIKLTPGHYLQLTSVCTGTWSHRPLKKTKLLMLYILFYISPRPITFSPSGKLQSQTKTLKHFGKFCSVCSPLLFPFAMLFQPRNIVITSQHCRGKGTCIGVSRTLARIVGTL